MPGRSGIRLNDLFLEFLGKLDTVRCCILSRSAVACGKLLPLGVRASGHGGCGSTACGSLLCQEILEAPNCTYNSFINSFIISAASWLLKGKSFCVCYFSVLFEQLSLASLNSP